MYWMKLLLKRWLKKKSSRWRKKRRRFWLIKGIRRILGEERGTMTVEASFITPVIVILFAAILFLFLFYLDVSYAKAMTIQVSDEVAQAWKVDGDITTGFYDIDKLIGRSTYYLVRRTSGDVAAQGKRKLKEALSGHLILTKAESSEVSISGMSVVSKVNLSFRWPFPALSRWVGNHGLSFTGKTRVPLEYREELLRMIGGDS